MINCIHNKLFKKAIFIIIIMLFNACATILTGSHQKIKLKSDPKGADVFINGQFTYQQTPCKVKVKRRQKKLTENHKNELNLVLKKEGYKNTEYTLQSSFNEWSALSIFMAGVPFLIDWASGAHLKYRRVNAFNMAPLEPVQVPLRNNTIATKEAPVFNKEQVSDVDLNIPETGFEHPYRFALIIGNEDYASRQSGLSGEANAIYAARDARVFKEYARKTLGIPEANIMHLTNATYAQMHRGITKMKLLAKNALGNAEIYFYYAGHGLPHEQTHEPYLIPVDVPGIDLDLAISLNQVYADFTAYPAKRVTCFIDCCFSGGARNKPLVAARGVKVVPKPVKIRGNLICFTASTGQQSAMPNKNQKHGLFTYYLLKKLQTTSGDVSYLELQQFLEKHVPLQSVLLNNKEQQPKVLVSPEFGDHWKDLKVN